MSYKGTHVHAHITIRAKVPCIDFGSSYSRKGTFQIVIPWDALQRKLSNHILIFCLCLTWDAFVGSPSCSNKRLLPYISAGIYCRKIYKVRVEICVTWSPAIQSSTSRESHVAQLIRHFENVVSPARHESLSVCLQRGPSVCRGPVCLPRACLSAEGLPVCLRRG